jgi:hypothetical protein
MNHNQEQWRKDLVERLGRLTQEERKCVISRLRILADGIIGDRFIGETLQYRAIRVETEAKELTECLNEDAGFWPETVSVASMWAAADLAVSLAHWHNKTPIGDRRVRPLTYANLHQRWQELLEELFSAKAEEKEGKHEAHEDHEHEDV